MALNFLFFILSFTLGLPVSLQIGPCQIPTSHHPWLCAIRPSPDQGLGLARLCQPVHCPFSLKQIRLSICSTLGKLQPQSKDRCRLQALCLVLELLHLQILNFYFFTFCLKFRDLSSMFLLYLHTFPECSSCDTLSINKE